MKSIRIGRFYISRSLIDSDPTAVQRIMARCIVVRAEILWHRDDIEYVAISGLFEKNSYHLVAPEYRILLDKDLNPTAERVP